MSILDNLPHTCDIIKRRRVTGSMGASRDINITEQSGVSCWRQFASAEETADFQKRGIAVTDKFYFTTDPVLTAEHLILIDGDYFEVRTKAKPDASAGLGVVFRIMAEEESGIK